MCELVRFRGAGMSFLLDRAGYLFPPVYSDCAKLTGSWLSPSP